MVLLKNKVAIVTGASSGIGYASAKLFAREGAKVVVGARRSKQLNKLVCEITSVGGDAVAVTGDVQSELFNQQIVESAISEFGRLDIAFNNAGILGEPVEITSQTLDEWNQIIQTNLTSAFLASKYQIPAMKENGGSVIFTSSFVGYTIGFPQQAAYAASKAGLIGLTKALASEYGDKNIRVNALLPGGTQTDMAKDFGDSPEVIEFVKSIHALKRIADPEEIARSALYLASDLSSFTTGTALLADGGVSVCKT